MCIIGGLRVGFAPGADRMSTHRLRYRGDIEGLRAVAILLVVAAHAGVPWLAGGFVGVDVFFVLSGYLITGVLLGELESTGHLQFAIFYARRFRRLLPALLVMLAGAGAVAVIALPPSAQGDQAMAAATASAWLSNIHFALAKLDYFSPGAAGNLFLHTWSLGVEEQFYLVWPALILWSFHGWAKANSTHRDKTRRLKTTMIFITTVSLAGCVVLTYSSPQIAFYMMPLRSWQFGIGALVWLYFGDPTKNERSDGAAVPSTSACHWLGWLGLGAVLLAAVWFDVNSSYPGWRSVLPTFGAAAIIAAGAHGATSGISRALSSKPLQAIGRVSYSWYLWHWPVLILGGVLLSTGGPVFRAALIAASFLLAVASYRWIESPIRHQARWIARPGVTVLAAFGIIVATSAICVRWSNAAWKWGQSPIQQRYAKARSDAPIIYSMGCDDWYHSDRVEPCIFGPADAKHTAVLMGDSVGAQWFPAVSVIFDRPGWRLIVLTKSACPMVDVTIFYPRIGRDYVECTVWRKHALERIAGWRPDVLMFGSVQTYELTPTQWLDGTERLLRSISSAARHIYVIRGTPHLPFNGPTCLASRNWLPLLRAGGNHCNAPVSDLRGDEVFRWQKQAASRVSNARVIDMGAVICPHGKCSAELDGVVVFRDTQHLSATFARSLGQQLLQAMDGATTLHDELGPAK
jgi:peptidoglycan/LPS O-acetylase OafA/YrhL